MTDLSRRTIIKAIGGAVLAIGLPLEGEAARARAAKAPTAAAVDQPTTYLFLQRDEAAFIEAVASRLIPADDQWPDALEARVPKELATAGSPFAKMRPDQQDAYLRRLDTGGQNLDGVPPEVFFSHLWQTTLETAPKQ